MDITDGIKNIIFEFRKGQDIGDDEVEEVLRLCRRKMEITGQKDDYILLLLPDVLKEHCFQRAINSYSTRLMKFRKELENVQYMQANTVPPQMSECTRAGSGSYLRVV